MKTRNLVLVALIAIFGMVGLVGCEDKDDGDDPITKTVPINFGTGLHTTVTATLTESEWSLIIPNLTSALNTVATSGGDPQSNATTLFGAGATIALVANLSYPHYLVNTESGVISLKTNYVLTASVADLVTQISNAVKGPFGGSLHGNAPNPNTHKGV